MSFSILIQLSSTGSIERRKKFHEVMWNTISKSFLDNPVNLMDDTGSFDILAKFGVHLMQKALDRVPVKLAEPMEIEEWI